MAVLLHTSNLLSPFGALDQGFELVEKAGCIAFCQWPAEVVRPSRGSRSASESLAHGLFDLRKHVSRGQCSAKSASAIESPGREPAAVLVMPGTASIAKYVPCVTAATIRLRWGLALSSMTVLEAKDLTSSIVLGGTLSRCRTFATAESSPMP